MSRPPRACFRRAALVGAALVLLQPALALAETAHYTAPRKFGRGLGSVVAAILEVPGTMVQTTRDAGPAWGFTLGFVTGLGRLVVRIPVGVYEILSFPFPLPPGYRPIIEPEYPWQYFESPTSPDRKRPKPSS